MRKFRKILVLMIIISMISNYFIILKEFGSAVYASTLELPLVEENELDDEFGEGASNDLLVFKSKLDRTSRYKGVLLANSLLENKKDFKIQDTLQIEVKSHDQIKSFVIEDENSMISSDGSSMDLVNNIEYKSIKIKESEYRNLVDKDGYIVILDGLNDEIARIDKSVESNAGTFDLNFVDGIKNIKILVSGIREDGKINIELGKKLVTTEFTRDQVYEFKEIRVKNTVTPILLDKEEVASEEPVATEIPAVEETVVDEVVEDVLLDEDTVVEEPITEELEGLLVDETKSENKVETEVLELKGNNFNSSEELVLSAEESAPASDQDIELDLNLDSSSDETIEDISIDEESVLPEKIIEIDLKEKDIEKSLVNEHSIALENTITEVTLDVSKDTLSSSITNDVELTLTLKNDSEEYDSFKNPVLKVSLPTSIKSAEVDSIKLLNKNGLTLESWKVEPNSEGRLILTVQISGTQEKYMTTVLSETTVVVGLKIEVDKMNTADKGTFELIYSNENATVLNYDVKGRDAEVFEIHYASIKEMLKIMKFEGFNSASDIVEELNNSKVILNLDTNGISRSVPASLRIRNNLKSDIAGLEIIGILPKINNIDENGNDYNNTFDMDLNSLIITNGLSCKISYSNSLDFENPNWEEGIVDLSSVKMFRIVIDEETIHQSDRLDVDFSLLLPGGLAENNMSFGNFIVNYKLNGLEVKEKMMYGFETEKILIEENQFENVAPLDVIDVDELLAGSNDATDDTSSPEEIVESSNSNESDVIDMALSPVDKEEVDDSKDTGTDVLPIESVMGSEEETIDKTEDAEKSADISVIPSTSNDTAPVIIDEKEIETFEVKSIVQKGTEVLNNGDKVDEGQLLRFKYSIKNVSNQTLHNVELKGNANNGNMYYYYTYETLSDSTGQTAITGDWVEDTDREYKEEKKIVESMAPGEIVDFEYEVKTNELTILRDEGNFVFGKITIDSSETSEKLFETEKYEITDGDLEVEVFPGNHYATDNDNTFTNDTYHIGAMVTNVSSEDMKNVMVDIYLDGNLTYYPASILWYPESIVEVDELTSGQKVSILIPEIKAGESQTAYFSASTIALDSDIEFVDAKYYAKVSYNGRDYISNEKIRRILQGSTQYEASITSDKVGEVLKNGDEIKYTIEVENVGVIEEIANIYDYIDDSMTLKDNKIFIMKNGLWEEQEYTENVLDGVLYPDYLLKLDPKQKAKIEISAYLDIEKCNFGDDSVKSELSVVDIERGTLINKIEYPEGYWDDDDVEDIETSIDGEVIESDDFMLDSDIIEHIVVDDSISVEGRKSFLSIKDELKQGNTIKGLSAIGDKTISGSIVADDNGNSPEDEMDVYLFEESDNEFDISTPASKVKTSKGKFEFNKLPEGRYIIAIKYSKDNYKIIPSENDEVTFVNKKIDDEYYAVSNEVNILKNNLENIEVRINKNDEYDLKINPVLDMITISEGEDISEITIEDSNDIEIDVSKEALKNGKVTATFYVSLSNEKNVSGNVNRVYAEIPEGWKFDKDLNIDWSLGNDGKIYTEKFKNILMEKDDTSSRVKLVLEKESGTSAGKYEVKFAIDSSSNAYGIEDGNDENDTSIIKFDIKKNNSKLLLIVLSIILIIVIIACILILKNEHLRKLLLKRIHVLTALVIVSLICFGVGNENKADISHSDLRKVYNSSKSLVNINGENANSWAMGQIYKGPNSFGTAYHANSGYSNIAQYMNDLYGYGSRKTFLYNGGNCRRSYRRAEAWGTPTNYGRYVRTMQCFHDTTITVVSHGQSKEIANDRAARDRKIFYGDYNNDTTTTLYVDAYWNIHTNASSAYGYPEVFKGYMIAVMDFAWDDGCSLSDSPYRYFDRSNGTLMSKVIFGENSNGSNRYYEGSRTGFMSQLVGYCGYASNSHIWTGSNSSYVDYIYNHYKGLIPSLKINYSSFTTFMRELAGVNLTKLGSDACRSIDSEGAIKDAGTKLKTFIDNNKSYYGAADTEKVKATNLGPDEIYPVGSGSAYVKLQIKHPKAGHDGVLNNKTYVDYLTDSGWKTYTGNFYTNSNGGGAIGQDGTYGLTSNRETLYMPIPSDLKYSTKNLRYRTEYTLYAARAIMHASGGEQDNMILRGAKYTKKSNVYLTIRSGGVEINKSIYSIDGSTSNKTYAEHDSVVIYKVTLKALKADLGQVKFVDTYTASDLTFVDYGTNTACTTKTGWTKSGETYTYTGKITKERTVTLYIKYKVKRYSDKRAEKTVRNKVDVTYVKLVSGNFVVYDKSKNVNHLLKGSIISSYVDFKVKMFGIKISKALYSIDGKTSNKEYAEKGCTIIYKVGIIALDNTIKNVKFDEKYSSSELAFKGISTSAGGTYSNSAGNWKRNKDEVSYNAKVNTSTTQYIYLKFEVICDNNKDNNKVINNTVNVKYLESGAKNYALYDTSKKIDYVDSKSVLTSKVSFKMRMYKASVEKSIVRITTADGKTVEYSGSAPRNKKTQVYAETGDIIIYCLTVKNEGDTDKYGIIRNLELTDTFKAKELEYLDYGSNIKMDKPSNFKWSKTGNYKFKYTYNRGTTTTSIGLGKNSKIYLKFKVTKMSKTNDDVTNTVKITALDNHHGKAVPINKLTSASVLTSSDTFKNRIYTLNVTKKINKIDNDTKNKSTSEVGDEIEYGISIKNPGTKAGDGVIFTVNVSDIYKSKQLNYVKHVDAAKWTIPSGKNVEGHYVFKNSEHIGKNATKSFKLTEKNVYRSKPDNQMINNRASIQKDDEVTNRNGVNIRSVLNGTLYSDVEFRYLTYHVDFRHYMKTNATVRSEDASEVIGGGSGAGNYSRINLTNKGKYNNPIEHEKNDKDVYYIRLENTGETTLYNITFTDKIMSGLEFTGYGSLWNVKSIKLYQKGKPVSTAVSKLSNLEVKSSKKTNVEFYYNSTLKPKEYLLIEIDVDIKKSNMYLWNLQSEAKIPSIKNKHNIEIRKTSETPNDILNLDVYENKEYIRMKNLIIQGTVWDDKDRDGVMDSNEKGIPNIIVNLVDATNNKKTTVKTDSNGKYIFAETNGIDINTGKNTSKKMVEADGRVIKATARNERTGNYYSKGRYDEYKTSAEQQLESNYINYYIEYEYNGARYRASVYSNDNNLDKPGYKINKSNKYLTDSNATEFHDMREEFQNRVGTINYNNTTSVSSKYNNANGGENSYRLRYNKNGHESTIIDSLSKSDGNPVLDMKAYSFVKDENLSGLTGIKGTNVNYLWLNKNDGATDNNCYTGETEYLKYINLGLETQELDLSLEKDVYSVRTTVNGREVVYNYNQGNNGEADKTTDYLGAYATGGKETGGVFTTKNYYFQFYNSDYYYRASQYENEAVKDYKQNTELDTEITYKITIKNNYDVNGFTDGTREHLYAVVNEIADYYPVEFVKYNPSNNKKIEKLYKKQETIMENDLTTNTDVPIIEAFYYDDDENKTGKHTLTISNTTSYPIKYNNKEPNDNELTNAKKNFESEGYYKLYIGGANAVGSESNLQSIVLDWNESKNIYIKYTLAKESNGNLKITNGNSVAEINSYSTYEKYNAATNTPSDYAGYIDCNSNPGNVGYNKTKNIFENLLKFKEYENDTYKTGIDMSLPSKTPPPPPTPGSLVEEETERSIVGTVWDDARTNEVISDNGGQAQYTGDGIKDTSKNKNSNARKNTIFDSKNKNEGLYKESYSKYNSNFEEKDSPVAGVKVKLIELVTINSYNADGTLKDSMVYEETINASTGSMMLTTTDNDGNFKLKGFIPGQYVVRYEYGYEGSNQDIKASMKVYNGQDYKSAVYNSKLDDVEINNINVDSVDGDEVLKALTGKNRKLNNTDTPDTTTYSDARDDAIMRLRANSYSEYVNNMKSNVLQNTLSNDYKYENELLNNTNVYAETPIFPVRPEDDTYTKETITYRFTDHQKIMKSSKRYSLEGIDFGVEYRPESDVDLTEYITEIRIATASGKEIYDLKYDLMYDGESENSRIIGSKLNEKTSTGFKEAQAIYNDIDESRKGFIYLNVDAETLQGASVEISYALNANNIGEVDRVAKTLDDMRDVEVAKSKIEDKYIYKESTGYEIMLSDNTLEKTKQYNATGTARNLLESEFWIAGGNGKVRTNKPRLAKTYYGKYLGSAFYTGNNNNAKYVDERDALVGLKISDIMDYVDNDMVFDMNKNNTENNYWRSTSSDELASRGMIKEQIFKVLDKQSNLGNNIRLLLGKIALVDSKGNRFDDENNSSRLALSMDDKINSSITKYLNPEVYNKNESASIINIKAIKTLSAETDLDNTKYDNSAEIVGYRALNGRVTTLASHSVKSEKYRTNNRVRTITTGNADFSDERLNVNTILGIGFSTEPDTAMAEVVSLAPPTGRYKMNYYLMTHRNLLRIIEVTIMMMICTPVAIILVKKAKNHKKVYR